MKLVYFGTSDFAVPSLEALAAAGHEIALVVTQPARRRGRGGKAETTPVGHAAERLGLEVFAPESVREPAAIERITAIAADAGVVAAYGQFLPRAILDWPRHGCVNVHASLLPAGRGAAPIARAILEGHERTGVCIMRVVPKMDAGPVLLSEATPIGSEENAGALEERLACLGAAMLLRALVSIENGWAKEQPQDEAAATRAPVITKAETIVPWTDAPDAIARRVRAMTPHPGASAVLERRDGTETRLVIVRVKQAERPADDADADPGVVLDTDGEGVLAAAGAGGAVRLLEVVPAGKRAMAASDWARGRGVAVGDRLIAP